MSKRSGRNNGGNRAGALRGRQRALLRRRLAGGTSTFAGGPVALDPVATTGAGATSILLVKVGVLSSATSGTGTTAIALRKIGALTIATAGAGASAAALQKVGVLSATLSGRSVLAAVLIDVRSLSAITSGQSALATPLVGIRLLSAATTGVGAAGATAQAIRALAAATVGEGVLAATAVAVRPFLAGTSGVGATSATLGVGGQDLTIAAATSGESVVDVTLENGAASAPVAVSARLTGGGHRIAMRGRLWSGEAHAVQPISASTRGNSRLGVVLELYHPPAPTKADDDSDDFFLFALAAA